MRYDSDNVSTHYSFGKNWLRYSKLIENTNLDSVTLDLARLLQLSNLSNKTVLDVGCGSGIHDVGFYRLGCRNLTAIDYDLDSITATIQTLRKFCPNANYKIHQGDILSENSKLLGKFDIVYSWGVLHHTGNLVEAIYRTADLVSADGLLALAVYRKTLMCRFWKIEKRIYSKLPKIFQVFFEIIYISLFSIGLLISKKITIFSYIKSYSSKRGMNFFADVRDWLGGYPYESISPQDLRKLLSELGFSPVYSLEGSSRIGIFGSGCDEFLFQKIDVKYP